MITKIYTFYDAGVKAYTTPFFMHNDGQAIRAFQDNVNAKEENNISKHPDQFTLFCIGEMDDQNGQIETYEPAKNLGNGLTYQEATVEEVANKLILDKVTAILEKMETKQ